MPVATPEELKTMLARLSDVEAEARALRAVIEQRLADRRREDTQDRSGQPAERLPKKRLRR